MSEPSPACLHGLTRANLSQHVREVLNRGNARNPDTLLVEIGGAQMVVKDFAPRRSWVRWSLGRWITRREVRAWRVLDGHPSVPRFLGQLDALAFAVEYRSGQRMSRKLASQRPRDFLPKLERAIRDMHALGVVHLDLRHRSNVLLDATGEPVLIDFASALCFRPGSWSARWLLPLFARVDRGAFVKWRARLGI